MRSHFFARTHFTPEHGRMTQGASIWSFRVPMRRRWTGLPSALAVKNQSRAWKMVSCFCQKIIRCLCSGRSLRTRQTARRHNLCGKAGIFQNSLRPTRFAQSLINRPELRLFLENFLKRYTIGFGPFHYLIRGLVFHFRVHSIPRR